MEKSIAIKISIDAKTGELTLLDQQFKGLGKSVASASATTKDFKDKMDILAHTTQGVLGSLQLVKMAFGAISAPVQLTDSMKLLESRIGLVASASDDYATIQKDLLKTANDNRTSLESVGQLYVKLKDPIVKLGGDTQTALEITSAFSKTLLISGANTQEAASATLQFAQAMASGVLRGDEFRSIAEASPKVLKVLSSELGVSAGQLRKMSEEGQLTAGVVGGALLSSLSSLEREAKSIKPTVSGAFQEFSNELSIVAGQFDKATGANDTLVKGINTLTDLLRGAPESFSRVSPVVYQLYKIAEKLNTLKIADDSFLGLLKSGKTTLSIDDSLLQSAAKAYNWTGQAMYGVLSEAWGMVDKSAGEWAKMVESGNRGFVGWADNIAKVTTGYDTVAKKIDEINTKEIRVPLRPEIKETTIASLSDFTKEEMRQRSIDTLEYNAQIEVARQKAEEEAKKAREKAIKESEQLEKDWSKKKLDLVKELSVAEQDELAKPYIELTAKYEEDLVKYASMTGAKEQLAKTYNANVQSLNEKTVKEFNEKELKTFEEGYTKRQDALKLYYEAIGDTQNVFYLEESKKLESLAKAGILSNEQMLEVREKDTAKFRKEEFEKNNKWLMDLFDNVEKAMDESFFDVTKGKFKSFGDWLKDFFGTIGDSIFRGLSRTLAGDLTNTVKSMLTGGASGSTGGFSLLGGLGTLAIGSTVSASEIGSLMNAGGTFDSATNTVKTSGGSLINLGTDGSGTIASGGTDIMSLMSTVSTLKSAYGLLNGGLASYIDSGLAYVGMGGNFAGTAGMFVNPLTGTATSSSLGSGTFINPTTLTAQSTLPSGGVAAQGASYGAVAGGAIIGGAIGYGVGSLGDSLFGAKTKAPVTGAIAGAALGGYAAIATIPAVGWIAAAALLLAGGAMGSTKIKDTGIQAMYDVTRDPTKFNNDASDGNATQGTEWLFDYTDKEWKSWFKSDKWSESMQVSESVRKGIEGTMDTFDILLERLGDTDTMVIKQGKYTGATIYDEMSKTFIENFTGIPQKVEELTYFTLKKLPEYVEDGIELFEKDILAQGSGTDDYSNLLSGVAYQTSSEMVDNKDFTKIYQQWVDYAESIDKTVAEALMTSVGEMVQTKRDFEIWNLNSKGYAVGATELAAKNAKDDLDDLAKSLGITGVTVENFTSEYENAVKNSFDPTTITNWNSLGGALRTATDAQKAYINALQQSAENMYNMQINLQKALGQDTYSTTREMLLGNAEWEAIKYWGEDSGFTKEMLEKNLAQVKSGNVGWVEANKLGMNDYINSLIEVIRLDTNQASKVTQSYQSYDYTAANNTVSVFTGLLDGLVESLSEQSSTLKSAYNTAKSMLNTLNANNVEYQVAQFKRYTAEADSYEALVRANPFDTVSSTKFAEALEGAQDYLGAYLDPNRFATEYDYKFAQLSTQNKLETYKATASLNTVMEDILSELKALKETATTQAQVNAAIARFEQRTSAVLEGIANGSIILQTQGVA